MMRERRYPQSQQPRAIAIAATRKAPGALFEALPLTLAALVSLALALLI